MGIEPETGLCRRIHLLLEANPVPVCFGDDAAVRCRKRLTTSGRKIDALDGHRVPRNRTSVLYTLLGSDASRRVGGTGGSIG